MTHLWEVDHDFYGADGYDDNEHDSWAEFMEYPQPSESMNVLYRWDWYRPEDDEWYDPDEYPEGGVESREHLKLCYLMPRKSAFFSIKVAVTAEDEPAVREWLTEQFQYLRTLWEPIAG